MYGYSWLHSGAAEFRIGGYEEDFVFRTISFFSFLSIFLSSNLLLAIYSAIRPLVYPQPPVFCGTRYEKEKGVSSSYPPSILNPA